MYRGIRYPCQPNWVTEDVGITLRDNIKLVCEFANSIQLAQHRFKKKK